MSRRRRDAEDEVRIRAHPRGSRPRSKDRPQHADAVPAWVVTVDRGRYRCVVGEGPSEADTGIVTAMTARELGRSKVVVGDRVALVGDISGREGTLARIVRVEERTTVLRRSPDDEDAGERALVANADQLAIVVALADPPPRPGMIDRCLVAAYDAGMDPLLVLTKSDLADAAALVELYQPLDVPMVVIQLQASGVPVTEPEDSCADCEDGAGFKNAAAEQGISAGSVDDNGLFEVAQRLRHRVTVLVGHSGVGKSTLVNALVPDAQRRVGEVNAVTGRGRHTSTSAYALPLPLGGWVIDTPGVRSFGLGHVDIDHVIAAFPDLADAITQCPPGCRHETTDPTTETGCALDALLADSAAAPSTIARIDSLRRLLNSRYQGDSFL